jgi:predicted MFS family arabinose efflux permease
MDGVERLGRRIGNRADYQNLLRLAQSLNAIHFLSGYPVEPVDLHHGVRHLWATYDALTLMDKAVHCYSLGRQRNIDVLEMVRIARGVDQATIDREPSVFTVVNSSSPLRLDAPMLQGIMEFAAHNQVVCITPFTLAGAMAPVTLAGALAEQNAEALAGMVLTQAVNPGAPVIYGGFTSNVDMQSGAPAFGTPEYMRTAMIGGQLARRYGVPYRSSNVNAANALDAQAAYESVFSLWGAIQGGVNLLMHGAGWMEGGLHASYEKMILDAELLGMVAAFLEPVVVDDETLAFSAMQEVGPGGQDLANAIALHSSVFNISRILGPSIGGLVIALIGVEGCFLVNALSFLALIFTLQQMDLPTWRPIAKSRALFTEVKEGFNYLRSNSQLFSVVALSYVVAMIGAPYATFVPVFATNVLHVGATGFGLLAAAPGIGATTAGLWLASLGDYRPSLFWMCFFILGYGLFLGLFAWSHYFILSLGLLVAVGFCFIAFRACLNTALQSATPPHLLGRVLSFFFMYRGLWSIGGLLLGTSASAIGINWTVGTAATICTLAAATVLLRFRHIRPAEVQSIP